MVGYGAILEAYRLQLPIPDILSIIGPKNRKYSTSQWQVFTPRYTPAETLYSHLTFALKYEGIHLLLLKKLFNTISEKDAITLIHQEPTGQYSRRIWFLYEWLMDQKLPIENLQQGNYVYLVDTQLQYAFQNGQRSSRHRIINNLPGVRHFCPLIRKTKKLEQYISESLHSQNQNKVEDIRNDIWHRAYAFLLLKDSKASFSIEGESPTNRRAARWGNAIGQAGLHDLNKNEFIRLQQIVIENPRFLDMGYRKKGGFVGEHERTTGEPIPEHISARWQDLDTLIDGLLDTYQLLIENDMNPVLVASVIAFGFVFIHPFEDGNGRIHRYIIHHILAKKQFSKQGMIFPVSASILDHIRDYRSVLRTYSSPVLDFIEWKETQDHNILVNNDTKDYYSYYDATLQAEFLFECVNDTIQNIIPREVEYLICYDTFKRYLEESFEMPDKMIASIVRFLEQNSGNLSKRAKEKEFQNLSEDEIVDIENRYKDIFLTK